MISKKMVLADRIGAAEVCPSATLRQAQGDNTQHTFEAGDIMKTKTGKILYP